MKAWLPESRVRFRWGDFFDCAPDWSWSVRDLPYLDLWYVSEGVGWIGGGERRRPIAADDCLLLRRGGSYTAGHDPDRPLNLIAVHFELLTPGGGRLDPPPGQSPPFSRKMEAGSFFRELLTRAVNCHRDGDREGASAWLQVALMEVIRQDARTRPAGLPGDRARQIARICERIRRDPGRRVCVEDLAGELHVSPKHFCRIFRHSQGMSPRAFITRTRMEAAQMLLLTSDHSVARIAEMLGYDTPFYFSRQFKAKVGFSPSGFRTGHRKGRPRSARSAGIRRADLHRAIPLRQGRGART